MDSLVLATATDITQWAATREAQGRLPELVRRLVYATTVSATYVDFPSGDSVQLGGADGATELHEPHTYVPEGFTIWELGADAKPKGKADKDYQKRTSEPPVTARGRTQLASTTFAFVTPRRWSKKDEWATSRKSEGAWKDVRVLDADDLEAWLQQAASVHVWFSRIVGRTPSGADDIETVWSDWAESVNPTAVPELVLAGRNDQVASITTWLAARSPGSLTIGAESPTDALGVIAATIVSLPEPEKTEIISRTVCVSTREALVQLSGSRSSLLIIPTYEPGNEIQRAIRNGHQLLLPSSETVGPQSRAQVVLARVSRHEAEKALRKMGLSEDRARDLAGVARRSMLTLRRQLARHPSLQLPLWAQPSNGPGLIPMLLLGQFNERREADLKVLEDLSKESWDVVRERLIRWSQEIDPLLRRVGGIWYLVSKEDAWSLLSRYVSIDDLKRFSSVAMDVLREVHPKFDLPAQDRWAASIHGKERKFSSTLTSGIADTIALMGALGGSVTVQGGVSPALVADRLVLDLFEAFQGDWRAWATVSSVLPLLAEGAPDVFLSSVQTQIASDEAAVQRLFRDEGDVLFSSSSHTGLLWALEVLAWSPEHLSYASRILASLDRLDPGGKLLNRPRNSLRSIFLFWLPQTAADVDTRLEVLRKLRTWEPESAWRLFESLLPRLHDHSSYNPRPKWRDWGTPEQATYADIFRQTSQIVAWMIEDAGASPKKWATLVGALDTARPKDFDSIVTGLRAALRLNTDDEFRGAVSDALRELLGRHRSFPKADWAMPSKHLEKIDVLYRAAVPSDPFVRLRWLFSNRPQLPEGREADFEGRLKRLEERRNEAINELYSVLGVEGIVALADKVDRPDELGRSLAVSGVVPEHDETKIMERLLATTEGAGGAFGRGYANGWTARLGVANARERIDKAASSWSDTTRARLLLSQVPDAETIRVVDKLDLSGREAFWSGVYPVWYDAAVLERGLRELLTHGRPHAMVDAAAIHLRNHPDLDPQLLAQGLELVARLPGDKDGQRAGVHDLSELLDALERAVDQGRFDEGKLAQLEFLYLQVLGHYTRQPRMLHRAMAKDPALFVDAVTHAFRAEGEEKTDVSESEAKLAQHAYHLLQTWRFPPGQSPSGIDSVALNVWVDKARSALSENGRIGIGDHIMGQVMSGSSTDSDQAWPAIPIRDLVERLASEQFERGLEIGRYNARGVITRNPSSGGDLERAEAHAYEKMAAVTASRWPRTSAMLRRMASSAMADAARHDMDSELREDLVH